MKKAELVLAIVGGIVVILLWIDGLSDAMSRDKIEPKDHAD